MLPVVRHFVVGLCLFSFLLCALSSEATSGRWTPDDALLADDVREVAVTRDGTLAAWVVRGYVTVEGESKPTGHLWWCRLPEGTPRQLTRGAERISAPAFSPDGKHLAFLSNRKPPAGGAKPAKDAGSQIWALPTDGGEAFPISHFDQSVNGFGWTSSRGLVAVVAESPSHWQAEREDMKDTSQVIDDAEHTPPVRLFTTTLDGTTKRLTTNQGWIRGLNIAPNGQNAVVIESHSLSYAFDQRIPPQTHVVDLTNGSMTPLFAEPVDGATVLPGAIAWNPSGSAIYVTNEHTRHPTYRIATITELYRHDVDLGSTIKVALDWPRGVARGFATTNDGVIALLADGVRFRPARLVAKR